MQIDREDGEGVNDEREKGTEEESDGMKDGRRLWERCARIS